MTSDDHDTVYPSSSRKPEDSGRNRNKWMKMASCLAREQVGDMSSGSLDGLLGGDARGVRARRVAVLALQEREHRSCMGESQSEGRS